MGVTAPTANHLLAKRSSTFGGDFNTQQAGRFAKFAAIRRASSVGQQALGIRLDYRTVVKAQRLLPCFRSSVELKT